MTTCTNEPRTSARWTALLFAAGLVLAGCGGGTPDIEFEVAPTDPPSTTAAPTTVAATTVPATAAPATAAPTTAATDGSVSPSTLPAPETADSWQSVTANLANMDSDCGNLTTLASEPGSDTVIAGVALRGLWSLDAPGNDWQPLGTAPGSDVLTNRTAAIRFDPERPGAFWASGTYSGVGVFATDDGGETLDALGGLEHIDVVSVDMTDPDRSTLLASRHEQPDVFLSQDGGDSWRSLADSLPDDIGRSNAPHVVDASTFLIGSWLTERPGIFRSTDAGETWTRVFDGYVLELGLPHVLPDGSILWVLHNGAGVVRSADGGATWEPWSFVPLAVAIEDMGDGRLASATGDQVVISGDDGVNWTFVGPPLPFRPASFAYVAGQETFYISQWDCEPRVRPDAVAALVITDG